MSKSLYTSFISGIVLLMNGNMAFAQGGSNSEAMLLDIVAHKPGTLNTPGAVVPPNGGGLGTPFGYEAILMQNADRQWEDDTATPRKNYAIGRQRDCDQSNPVGGGQPNLSEWRKAHDSDLVKIELKINLQNPAAGSSLKLIVQKMTVDPTKTTPELAVAVDVEGDATGSKVNFYKANGTRITDPIADLKVDDCTNPGSSYLAGILSATPVDGWRTLVLFVEGQAYFGHTGTDYLKLGGARFKFEYAVNGTAIAEKKLLLYRGGFLIFRQPAGQPGTNGTLEFWSGKGRVKHKWDASGGKDASGNTKPRVEFVNEGTDTITDDGVLINDNGGPPNLPGWAAKSGHPIPYGSASYWLEDKGGHTPPGWWAAAETERTDRGPKYEDWPDGSGRTVQGYYSRWPNDDLPTTDPDQYTNKYFFDPNPDNTRDKKIGPPPAKAAPVGYRDAYCNFKFDTHQPIRNLKATWFSRSK